jgi:outer membrane protein assembly factor BamB
VWRNRERVEVVASGERLVTSHDPSSGKELWRVAGVQGPSMCSFAADAERLYFGQKNPMSNPPLYALNAGAEGDLSPAPGASDVKHQAWLLKNASPDMPSPVAVDGLLYVAADLLTCRDASTGEQLYKERLGERFTMAASPVVVGDKLLLLAEEGHAAIVQVGPEFEVVGRGELDDLFWATPTVAGDALLLRGVAALYCVRK